MLITRGKQWNNLGYFEEGHPIRINWFKQFVEIHARLGWEVDKVHPELQISKILELEVVDRGAVRKLMDYGFKHAGYSYPVACAKVANWPALGEIGWIMLNAPTLRAAFGALAIYASLVDVALTIETTDDKGRFIVCVTYDFEDRHHRDISNLFSAAALEKFITAFSGGTQRGNNVNFRIDCVSAPAMVLQEQFWGAILEVGRRDSTEISIDNDFASKKNVNFTKRAWEKCREDMRNLWGVEVGVTKAQRYASILTMNVQNWDYQNKGKPNLKWMCENMKLSERGMRSLLAKQGTSPKEVIMKAEARRIHLAVKRGNSMTDAAEMYAWSNVTNMKKMVKEYLGVDLKQVKPFAYIDK